MCITVAVCSVLACSRQQVLQVTLIPFETSPDSAQHITATTPYCHAGSDDQSKEHLDHVGLVVWQSAFVMAEYLLRHPPFGQWHDVHAVDLGTGTGEPCWRLPLVQVILNPYLSSACSVWLLSKQTALSLRARTFYFFNNFSRPFI